MRGGAVTVSTLFLPQKLIACSCARRYLKHRHCLSTLIALYWTLIVAATEAMRMGKLRLLRDRDGNRKIKNKTKRTCFKASLAAYEITCVISITRHSATSYCYYRTAHLASCQIKIVCKQESKVNVQFQIHMLIYLIQINLTNV